jgi:succinoglycan biosynthesis transport protein ExoP
MDPNLSAPAEQPEGDLMGYLEAPLKRPRIVLTTFAVIFAITLAVDFALPRKYRSNTLILLESEKVSEALVTPVSTETQARRLDTIRQIVLSRTFLEKIIKELNPYPGETGSPMSSVVDTMRAAIQLRVQGTDSFSVEYVNRDPRKAMEVANRIASGFIEDATAVHDRQVKGAFAFLQTSLTDARGSLEAKESELRKYKQRYMGSLPEQLQTNLSTLQGLRFEAQTLSETLRGLDERRDFLANQDRGTATLTPDAAQKNLAKLRADLDSLLGRYTDEHPDVRTARARIAQAEKQLADSQQNPSPLPADTDPESSAQRRTLAVLDAQAQALRSKMDRLDREIAAVQARVDQTPQVEQVLADLNRDYTQLQENYDRASKKEMAADEFEKLEKFWGATSFRIQDPATIPERPVSPPSFLIILGGFLLGLGAGVTGAIVADVLDQSVRNSRELEALLPFPVLMTIPYAGRRALSKRRAVA